MTTDYSKLSMKTLKSLKKHYQQVLIHKTAVMAKHKENTAWYSRAFQEAKTAAERLAKIKAALDGKE